MEIVILALVTLALITSLLLVVTAGLLVYRDRQQLRLMTDRLLAEQRIRAATGATLQAMRDAARSSRRDDQPCSAPGPDGQRHQSREGQAPRFATLLADPPWDIQQRGGGHIGAEEHYALMSVDQLSALPVAGLARESAHLWLWVTNASLFAGQRVMDAWGFSYRSILTWIKPTFGLGRYLRTQTEHLLFGVRGFAPIRFRSQGSWFYAPRQEHSHKPEEQYAIIERCSPGPYLELFARRPRPGWDVWDNEVQSDVDL